MIDIDWNAPVGGMAEVLACVPGLKANTLAQWQARDKVSRRGAGHGGRATIWHAHDVLEVATLYELGRIGVILDKAAYVWAAIRGSMLARQFSGPHCLAEPCALFTLDEDGSVIVRMCDEAAPEGSANGADMDRADAPDVIVMFRVGRIMDRLAVRIAAVAPGAVRDSRRVS